MAWAPAEFLRCGAAVARCLLLGGILLLWRGYLRAYLCPSQQSLAGKAEAEQEEEPEVGQEALGFLDQSFIPWGLEQIRVSV